MLDFMVIGLPRSATTWAANFFTTEKAICLHDPLYTRHYRDLDAIRYDGKKVGVACTGLWNFPTFVNAHPAKKIILRRPLDQVNAELAAIGLPGVGEEQEAQLATLNGEHFPFSDLFNPHYAAQMCATIGLPFDADRHAQLVQIEMQPKFAGLTINKEVTRQLVEELTEALQWNVERRVAP